ncbi:MAG: class I tRNA ligase family protein, partial [Acidobacteriota bacterium]|nr:class I tRNA ligase family protein [Acidobacteriota bacterium]
MPEIPNKFYVTTPIYYVNARPHIGHAYTTIVADVLARRHRLLGDDTFFLTGTDEHGQKIERSAAAAGVPPQQFADQVSASFENLWKRMGITNDRYIRTTDEKHKRGVQHLFSELYARGFITLASYTGQYCVSEETFVDGPPGTIGPDGLPTETVTEENFFFKLSAFQRPLLDLIESDALKIEPEARKNEVLSFLRGNVSAATNPANDAAPSEVVILSEAKDLLSFQAAHALTLAHSTLGNAYVPGALKDLSISRSSFTWGIPVPEPAASTAAQKHVIYVWLDALANYMTAIGYGSDSPADQAEFARYWPANLHLVGKEIIRHHCVYWPAFLLALNPEFTKPKGIVILSAAKDLLLDRSSTEPGAPGLASETWVPAPPQLSLAQHKLWAAKMLPKAVTAHGWLLFDNSKMSKSKGNIVRTETILEGFGEHVYAKQFPDSTKEERDLFAADVLRYFLLREIPFSQDGSFSFDAMITRYNADLANGYGNLVSRTLNLIEQNQNGVITAADEPWLCQSEESLVMENERKILKEAFPGTSKTIWTIKELESSFESIRDVYVPNLTSIIARKIGIVDGYLSANTPWKLAKSGESTDRQKMNEVLYTAAEAIRIVTALLYPILPNATAKVWLQLGLGDIET